MSCHFSAMHSSGPPCITLVWWSRKVCKISSHSLQAFTILFLMAVSVCETSSPVSMTLTIIGKSPELMDSSQLLPREKRVERRAVEVGKGQIPQVGVRQSSALFPVSTFWEGFIKVLPCGRKPPIPSVS